VDEQRDAKSRSPAALRFSGCDPLGTPGRADPGVEMNFMGKVRSTLASRILASIYWHPYPDRHPAFFYFPLSVL
jgi:hypothetical protein